MLNEIKPEDQEMPCPRCKTLHKKGEYKPQPERQKDGKGIPYGPDHVQCDCGAKLMHVVPLFMNSHFGWEWRIM
jgi:hypothetical protein